MKMLTLCLPMWWVLIRLSARFHLIFSVDRTGPAWRNASQAEKDSNKSMQIFEIPKFKIRNTKRKKKERVDSDGATRECLKD